MNYDGPGTYRHYKGGLYEALGVGEHESTGAKLVVYVSDSTGHTALRQGRGVNFILRPLNIEDGPGAFNDMVQVGRSELMPRFERVPAQRLDAVVGGHSDLIDLDKPL